MSQALDLELLREVFKDVRMHIGFGVITQMALATDNSCLRVQVSLLPERRDIIAEMSFADVYQVTFPEVNDAVIVAFVEGEPDLAYVVARFSSIEEPIPTLARGGDSVHYSRPKKKMFIGSDTKVGLARVGIDPSSALVLGDVFTTFMDNVLTVMINTEQKLMDFVDVFNAHVHTSSAPGILTTVTLPTSVTAATVVKVAASGYKTTLTNQKASPLDDGTILSAIAFTERGV